ncbi:hypothetical protein [Streptomyces sp. NPDC053069]|uniref:hypothetical protein n=1 Tax=Streptomyces sp. NPDC053069 TaxID=3365695 RepID=UPI0037CED582
MNSAQWASLLAGIGGVVAGSIAPIYDKHKSKLVGLGAVLIVVALITGVVGTFSGGRDKVDAHPGSRSPSSAPSKSAPVPTTQSEVPSAAGVSETPDRTPESDPAHALDKYMDAPQDIEVGEGNYLDVDSMRLGREGGQNYDVHLDGERLFYGHTYGTADTTVSVITNDLVPACASRGRPEDVVFLYEMHANESVCVKSSAGRWTLLVPVKYDSDTAVETFRVGYLKNPT